MHSGLAVRGDRPVKAIVDIGIDAANLLDVVECHNRHRPKLIKTLLKKLEREFACQGWTVDCGGHLDGYSTLRIGLPSGVSQDAVEHKFGAQSFFDQKWKKVVFVYDGMKTQRGCATY